MTMTDVIGPAAKWPGFGGNSLTEPGMGVCRNAESCQIMNVYTHSTVRLKPCTMHCKEPYKEVNKKDRKWNRETDDKNDGGEKAEGD